MVKNTYACTGCKKTFSRKYNAERHNKLKHNEIAVVYNKETDWVSNKRRIQATPQQKPHDSSSSLSLQSSTPFSHTTSTADIDNKSSNVSKPYYDLLKEFNFKDQNLEIDENTDFEKIFKIFEKISPLIDELDTLLITTYIQNLNKTQILASVIISSLTSQNPVKFIKDQINFYRAFIGIKKASGFVALSQNIPMEQAQLMLKSIILAAPYSKNKFDNKIRNI